MRRWSYVLMCVVVGVALAGCPKNNGNHDYKAGEKAFDLKDYDAAVDYYSKALTDDPHNAFYRIKLNDARFEAGQVHVHQGLKLRDKGDLQGAVAELQRAQILDPSSVIADQELKKTLDMLAERVRTSEQQTEEQRPLVENGQPALATEPPELKPLSRAPIS
jgi:general secretion pathway protein D